VAHDEEGIPANILLGDEPLRIGARGDDLRRLSGQIDDVRVYERTLGAGEVAALAQR
jgi:hypothetical protein